MTSFYPIYLFALNLTDGIEALQVENLAPPDTGCLHDYQLQMGDMKALAEADLFLVNGAGMENFLPLVTEALPTLTVCEATVGIELLDDAEQENTLFEAESEVNSHVWLDAKKAAQMVENLAAALMETYPQFDVQLTENRDGLLQRLEVLDEELRNGLSDLAHRQIITFHEAFPYFAKAYDLQVVAVVNREPGDALSPSQLAELTDLVKALGLPPLFVEPQYEDLAARTLAQETGAAVYMLDPCVTGPEDNIPLDYYEQIMRQNMTVLQEALSD